MSEVSLYNADCNIQMQSLVDDGVQVSCTVTSPPYDNLRTYENSLEWNEAVWKKCLSLLYDITEENGVVVWVVGDAVLNGSETGTSFKQALYAMECGFKLHDTMIYEKNSSTFPARANSNRYTQIFEYMFVFTKGSPQKNLICDKKNKWAGFKDYSGKLKNPVPEFSPRTNIWKYITSKGKTGDHTAPFPEELVKDHILTWCRGGGDCIRPIYG
jgi:DNA modification methylase